MNALSHKINRLFIESITEYSLSQDGKKITGFTEIEKNSYQYFEYTGSKARKIHRLRVKLEDSL